MTDFLSDQPSDHRNVERVAVVCPHCGHAYRLARTLVGRKLKCKECREYWRAKEIPADEISRYRRDRVGADSGRTDLYNEGVSHNDSSSVAIDMSWAGRKIGRYMAKSLLGHGGMGVVWRAHDDSLRRDVALKILTRTRADTERSGLNLDLFMQEARAVARLQHPAVVAIYEIDEDHGHVFLALELMDGGTLKEHVERNGPIKPRRLFEWMIAPVKALALAHRSNIIHRDIKPSNLMFDDHGHMKLMDFGLADVAGEDVSHRLRGKAVGSLGWIAPETAQGRETTTRSDLYSLGLVMYYAMTGKPLINGKSRSIVINLHRNPPPPNLDAVPGLTPAGRRLLEKCLEVDPEARFQTASELLHELETCAAEDISSKRQQRKATLTFVAIAAIISAILSVGSVLYYMVDMMNREQAAAEPAHTVRSALPDQANRDATPAPAPAATTEPSAPDAPSAGISTSPAQASQPAVEKMRLSPTSDLSDYREPWPGIVDVTEYPFIASARGRVFHRADAECAAKIFASNLTVFKRYADAIADGRTPCPQCHPESSVAETSAAIPAP
ncbi:MAG TPA: protein kinase [Phycisphaerae bacterium]|nr:protein kinase [Phycisphaerae bacterium]HRW53973.1 protein kinase [Phycisphaerae bacterium]